MSKSKALTTKKIESIREPGCYADPGCRCLYFQLTDGGSRSFSTATSAEERGHGWAWGQCPE